MISGWGEERDWPGFRFSLECKNHMLRIYIAIACLVTMARYCSLCITTHLPRPEIDVCFIEQVSLLSCLVPAHSFPVAISA